MISRLGTRILVPSLAIVVTGLVATLVVTYLATYRAALRISAQQLRREARMAAHTIDTWLQDRMIDLDLWTQDEHLLQLLQQPGVPSPQHQQRVQRFLTARQQGSSSYESVFLANTQGRVLAFSTKKARPPESMLLLDRPYFHDTLANHQIVSSVLASRFSGNQAVVITAPVKASNEIIGVLGGVVNCSTFTALLLCNGQPDESGAAFLRDGNGLILTTSLPEWQGQGSLPQAADLSPGEVPQGEVRRTGKSDLLTASHRIEHGNWLLVLASPVDLLLRPLSTAGQMSAVITSLLLTATLLVIVILHHRLITTRLHAMLQVMGQVKAGDLDHRIPESSKKPDELDELTASVNTMINQIKDAVNQLDQEIRIRKDSEHLLASQHNNLERLLAEHSREQDIVRQRIEDSLTRSEKLEMIGTLAGGIAHDLNNVLSGVVTYPDLLLLNLSTDNPLNTPLQIIKRSGERAVAIIQDLLTLSGNRRLIQEPVCLTTLVHQFLQGPKYRRVHERFPHIDIRYACSTDPVTLLGSPDCLAKALMYLLDNAMTRMDRDGHIALSTRQRFVETPLPVYEYIRPGAYAVLEVKEFGRPLPPGHLARIFEPFYTRNTMGLPGTGLEMAMVRGIVRAHGGYIDCASETAQETRFTLFFPLAGQGHPAQQIARPHGPA